MKTDSARRILFPFVWKPVLLKEFKGKRDRDSSSKQTTSSLSVNKLTFPPAPGVQTSPPQPLICHLHSWACSLVTNPLLLAFNSTSLGQFPGKHCKESIVAMLLTIAWKYCYLDCLQLVVFNGGKERAAAATAELKRGNAHYFLFVERVAKITYWA